MVAIASLVIAMLLLGVCFVSWVVAKVLLNSGCGMPGGSAAVVTQVLWYLR